MNTRQRLLSFLKILLSRFRSHPKKHIAGARIYLPIAFLGLYKTNYQARRAEERM